MRNLTVPANRRSLFFFSGHGIELRLSHQVLLPSDYLPPDGSVNESISTRNLIDWLPYLSGVSSHVLLLDGCREDIAELRGSNLGGEDLLRRFGRKCRDGDAAKLEELFAMKAK